MTKNDYEQLFVKLITQFGSKAYSQDRINLIYNEVKNITSGDFERLVTYFIGHSKTAPLVPEFRKAIFDLSIKSTYSYTAPAQDLSGNKLDWEYPVRVGLWANSKYFHVRGEAKPMFIIKEDCKDGQLLSEDKIARDKWVPFFQKITDPNYDGSLGSYTEHFQKAVKNYG